MQIIPTQTENFKNVALATIAADHWQAQSDPWQQQREAMLAQLLESCPDEKNAILNSYLKAQCERERGETL